MTATDPRPFRVAFRPGAGQSGRCWHVVATFAPFTGRSYARTAIRAEADRLAADLNARSAELRAVRR